MHRPPPISLGLPFHACASKLASCVPSWVPPMLASRVLSSKPPAVPIYSIKFNCRVGLDRNTNIIAAVAKMSPAMCEAYPSTSRTLEAASPTRLKERRGGSLTSVMATVAMSALGQKQTYAVHKRMSALHPIATAKADTPQKSCLLYPQERTCTVHYLMSAKGQKRTPHDGIRSPKLNNCNMRRCRRHSLVQSVSR